MSTKFAQLRKVFQEWWWRHRGEQALVITFWPHDYPRGTSHWINGQRYVITRYVRSADPSFFEVWGKVTAPQGNACGNADVLGTGSQCIGRDTNS